MKRNKKIVPALLAGILAVEMALSSPMDVLAASNAEYSKNENVYVRMDTEGEVDGIYVVNAFTVTDAGEITDYGKYDSILNLTNLNEIEQDKDEYTINAEKGKFYYQGNLSHVEIPWNFDITYILDGKEVNEEELAGAEGDLEIRMKVRENPNAENPAFYHAYLLQVSFTLDSELCEDIEAKGASIADAGSDEKITFTVMPNLGTDHLDQNKPEGAEDTDAEESEDTDAEQPESAEDTGAVTELVVKASVTDFEMDDISIAAAAMTDFPVSFVSDENTNTKQTMFIISAEGITIPEEKIIVETVEDNRNFLQKMIDNIKNKRVK